MTEPFAITSPLDVLTGWERAWAARDAAALGALFVGDAEFVNVVGLWWHNRAEIERAHAYGFDVIFADSTFEFTSRRVRDIGEVGAVVHGRWRLTGQSMPGGAPTQARFGILTFVLQAQAPLGKPEAGWLVVAAHNTDIIAGAESIAVTDGHSRPVDYR